MASVAAFALLGLAEANVYAKYYNARCYAGHGGTPLDADDTPIRNITVEHSEDRNDWKSTRLSVASGLLVLLRSTRLYGTLGSQDANISCHSERGRPAELTKRPQIDCKG